jgi:hypothetical protein
MLVTARARETDVAVIGEIDAALVEAKVGRRKIAV